MKNIYKIFPYRTKVDKVIPNFSLLFDRDPLKFHYPIKWFDFASWWILFKNWVYNIDLKVLFIENKKYFLIFDDAHRMQMYCLDYDLYLNAFKKIRNWIKKLLYQSSATSWQKKNVLRMINHQHVVQYLELKDEFLQIISSQLGEFIKETYQLEHIF